MRSFIAVKLSIILLIFSAVLIVAGCAARPTVPASVLTGGKIPIQAAIVLPTIIDWEHKIGSDNKLGWSGAIEISNPVPAHIGNKRGWYEDGQGFGQALIQLIKDGMPFALDKVHYYYSFQEYQKYPVIIKFLVPKASVKERDVWKRKQYTYTFKEGNFTEWDISVKLEAQIFDKKGGMINTASGSAQKRDDSDEPLMVRGYIDKGKVAVMEMAFERLIADIQQKVKTATISSELKFPLDNCDSYGGSPESTIRELDRLVDDIAMNIGKKRVAVIGFSDSNGTITSFGRYLTEEITNRLRAKRVNLVETKHIKKATKSLGFHDSNRLNQKMVKQFGALTFADDMLIGMINDKGHTIQIDLQIVDTESGMAHYTLPYQITKTGFVCEWMSR